MALQSIIMDVIPAYMKIRETHQRIDINPLS